ncbi:hypothetical protein L1281_002573, partial [Neisseria sp. HSC-16F19]|nr:hypothetical protein [Neisseria sp. HSC-16F19]
PGFDLIKLPVDEAVDALAGLAEALGNGALYVRLFVFGGRIRLLPIYQILRADN